MGTGTEILVDEGSWAGVTCGWEQKEASHTLAQLGDEEGWIHRLCGGCHELAGDSQGFPVHELN
jgi:hypothetical protein